ncbi:AbrB/MazE/SpoVT family DNA-binding domain-containing protein [Planococcus lenghuensis]|uniref:SpoVT-AbrB domain-containing protein n=1 Tax=Planococcus lenghuensis TaxID=2213202 RepID=A0A1Q2KYR2_9BACL|nr:AbrB/MazE/SpoVT family DNA-binding domain-containing protein [Planococcus lenghuensis]AQQ53329.1 hypothetical protein B0X71_09720 [Planococcus lenghuensis]
MPNIATAKLTSKGQVTLPKEVRMMLQVDSGDKLQFEFDSDTQEVVIRKTASKNELEQLFAGWDLENPDAAIEIRQLMEDELDYDGPVGGEQI